MREPGDLNWALGGMSWRRSTNVNRVMDSFCVIPFINCRCRDSPCFVLCRRNPDHRVLFTSPLKAHDILVCNIFRSQQPFGSNASATLKADKLEAMALVVFEKAALTRLSMIRLAR